MASGEPIAPRRGGRDFRRRSLVRRLVPAVVLAVLHFPGILWLGIFFILPFYVVLSVAFGTVDPLFRTPLPVYQPWWWSFATFSDTLQKFVGGGDRIYLDPLIRTLLYVVSASAICVVVGYAVAYYTARQAGRHRGLILVLLISPFWISYLMRIYAWQSLLQPDGYINDLAGVLGIAPVDLARGQARDGGPRPRLRLHPVHDPSAVRVPRPHRPEPARGRPRHGRGLARDVPPGHAPPVEARRSSPVS